MDPIHAEVPVVVHLPGMPYAPAYEALIRHVRDGRGCERCACALALPDDEECGGFCDIGYSAVCIVEDRMHDTADAAVWN